MLQGKKAFKGTVLFGNLIPHNFLKHNTLCGITLIINFYSIK